MPTLDAFQRTRGTHARAVVLFFFFLFFQTGAAAGREKHGLAHARTEVVALLLTAEEDEVRVEGEDKRSPAKVGKIQTQNVGRKDVPTGVL